MATPEGSDAATTETGRRHGTAVAGRVPARDRLIDTASRLFYERGINTVGVDTVTEEAGVAKMTLYRNFRSKSELVSAYLEKRHQGWEAFFQERVLSLDVPPREKILILYDVLGEWFESAEFSGCAYINADAERVDARVHEIILHHKDAMREMIRRLCDEAGVGDPDAVAGQLFLLMEGCIVTARVQRGSWPARVARDAAASLLAAAR